LIYETLILAYYSPKIKDSTSFFVSPRGSVRFRIKNR